MKTPEQIIADLKNVGGYTKEQMLYLESCEDWVIRLMKLYGNQEFNRALDLAAEKAHFIFGADHVKDGRVSLQVYTDAAIYITIDKDSITDLKLKNRCNICGGEPDHTPDCTFFIPGITKTGEI